MNKVVTITKDNEKEFYNKIRKLKILSKFNYNFIVDYDNKKYDENSKDIPKELETIMNIIKILNTKKKKNKYELIYDLSCDCLDNEFQTNNYCSFENNMCICNRCKNKEKQLSSCCQRRHNMTTCKYFDDKNKCCSIKCIGCKFFTCDYLRKKGINYKVNSIPYIKYFFNIRQKLICKYSFFTEKDIIINKLSKFYKLP